MPKKYNLIIGRHCLLKAPNYLPGAVEEAVNYGANSLMVFLGAPQNSYRPPLENLKIPEFKQVLAQNNIADSQVIVHGPYLINLANASNSKVFSWSVEFLKKELIRAEKIGAKIFVLHPGSALKSPLPAALDQVVKGLDLALQNNSQIRIALETMSGRGSEIGSNFEQLQAIIERVKHKKRVGVCWDTCHLWAAGYDLKNNLEQIIKDFEAKIGLEKLWVIHINDSLFELGSQQDRHQNLGYGKIGWTTLQKIVYHPKFERIIKILETPRKLDYQTEIKRLRKKKSNCDI